jgi:hypothetical protein
MTLPFLGKDYRKIHMMSKGKRNPKAMLLQAGSHCGARQVALLSVMLEFCFQLF